MEIKFIQSGGSITHYHVKVDGKLYTLDAFGNNIEQAKQRATSLLKDLHDVDYAANDVVFEKSFQFMGDDGKLHS